MFIPSCQLWYTNLIDPLYLLYCKYICFVVRLTPFYRASRPGKVVTRPIGWERIMTSCLSSPSLYIPDLWKWRLNFKYGKSRASQFPKNGDLRSVFDELTYFDYFWLPLRFLKVRSWQMRKSIKSSLVWKMTTAMCSMMVSLEFDNFYDTSFVNYKYDCRYSKF